MRCIGSSLYSELSDPIETLLPISQPGKPIATDVNTIVSHCNGASLIMVLTLFDTTQSFTGILIQA